jgi:predicted dehydrogenase
MKKIALVGLGLIGKEHAKAVETLQRRGHDVQIAAGYDPDDAASDLARTHGFALSKSLEEVAECRPDLVVVATPHNAAVPVTKFFLDEGLTVLLEKPLGRDYREACQIVEHCRRSDQLFIGHNYRFFPGIRSLAEDLRAGVFGELIGLSILLGHGGSPKDKASWKLSPEKAGGGVLIDPGIHLLDLCLYLGQEIRFLAGTTWSGFWQTGIEEECRLLFSGSPVRSVDMTISVVRWRSTFRIEVFGKEGYGIVTGRGRSYGPQQYRRGKRWGWQRHKSQLDSEELVVESDCEASFADELESLIFAHAAGTPHACLSSEALDNMKLLDDIRAAVGLARPAEI